MKILQLTIEQYGHWRDLALSFDPQQFNAMFGPNEAGKTTLMRFMRGVLFGFPPASPRLPGQHCAGELVVEHHGQTWRIHRSDALLSLSGPESLSGSDAERQLERLLNGITRETFEAVFCFGLEELQQFALLQGDDIVEKLFGVSLGPEGRFVLDGMKRTEFERQQVLQDHDARGALRRALDEHQRVTDELESVRNDKNRTRQLRTELERIDSHVDRMQGRRNEIQHERRGHQFLQRVHGPWSEMQELRRRLERVPVVPSFPANGVAELDAVEQQLRQCREQLDARRDALKRLKKQLAPGGDQTGFRSHAGAVEVLLQQLSGLEATVRETESLREELRELDGEIRAFRGTHRLDNRSLSPAISSGDEPFAHALSAAGTRYQSAARRLALARKRIDRLSHAIQQTQDELKLASRGWQGQSAAEMLERTRREIGLSEQRTRLSLTSEHLTERVHDREQQLQTLAEREPLPKGAQFLLYGFAIAGALLGVLGIWQGVTVSGLAGAVYFLLGLTCSGLGMALSWHFSDAHQQQVAELELSVGECRKQQRVTLEELRRVGQGDAKSNDPIALSEQLRSLQTWADRERKLVEDRKRASQLRTQVQELRRAYSQQREQWCQTLRRCGLSETLRGDDAWNEWNTLKSLAALEQRRRDIENRLGDLAAGRSAFDACVRRVEEALSGRAPQTTIEQILSGWKEQLKQHRLDRASRRERQAEVRTIQTEISQLQRRGRELRGRRSDLLSAVGATDRTTFDDRARWYAERVELEQLRELALLELNSATGSDSELAVVEEDLLAWNADDCRETLSRLAHEWESLEHDLEREFERRGKIRQELESLQSGQREARLRQQQAELEELLLADCERLLGIAATETALQEIRERLERDHRPETLVRAERHFRSLTGGRYTRIWAPLGERNLFVEDRSGETRALNDLSGGTREQLLLALRLSLVEEMRQQGMELPFLLDDILVNFDHERASLAFDTLFEFAREGSQTLMLTCHQHLAEQLRQRGTYVSTLPERTWAVERMAG